MSTEYSVVQLEKALNRRKTRLRKLIQRRDRLRRELAKLEKEIVAVGGAVVDGRCGQQSQGSLPSTPAAGSIGGALGAPHRGEIVSRALFNSSRGVATRESAR